MLKQCRPSTFNLLPLLILSSIAQGSGRLLTQQNGSTHSIPAVFIFGDSTVDPGNNNYLNTIFKSNFPPYGNDFPGQKPTGRFTNGRLTTDFIASYVGIKQSIPPYLDPNLSVEDLTTGVSFASAGSGYDPQTASRIGVLGLSMQLEYFKEYKTRLEKLVGKKRTEYIVSNGVFAVSSGTNDIVDNYGATTSTPNDGGVQTYLDSLLSQFRLFVQGVQEQGGRRIGVVGLPPAGCLPVVITLHSLIEARRCVDSLSSISQHFNQMLQNELNSIKHSQPNLVVAFADIYTPLLDQINNPHKYGFEEVNRGCCGTGILEASFACNPFSPICSDPSGHVFWDAVHPTERSYYFLFQNAIPSIDYFLHS